MRIPTGPKVSILIRLAPLVLKIGSLIPIIT
jgi:hypothetical protein